MPGIDQPNQFPLCITLRVLYLPTYGATPIAVGTNPRYNALTPPSSLMTRIVMPHTVRSWAEKKGAAAGRGTDAEAVWYAEARAG